MGAGAALWCSAQVSHCGASLVGEHGLLGHHGVPVFGTCGSLVVPRALEDRDSIMVAHRKNSAVCSMWDVRIMGTDPYLLH